MNRENNDKYLVNHHQDSGNDVSPLQSETKRPLLYSIIHKLVPFSMLWVSLVLMYGVVCMYTNAMGQDEFYRFIFFLRHPVVVALNALALFAALLHSMIWFHLLPQKLSSASGHKSVFSYLFTLCLWVVTLAISIFLVLFVLK